MNNPIDSRQLLIFEKVASTGSYTMAAKKLFLTQSAISHSIKSLEKDIGCTLFDKIGKKIYLTSEGEIFKDFALKTLNSMYEIRNTISGRNELDVSRVRIATSSSISKNFLPEVLREFIVSFPKCKWEIHECDTPEAFELLRKSSIDLAITLSPEKEQDFETIPLFKDQLELICSPNSKLKNKKNIHLSSLESERIFIYRKQSYTYRFLLDYFKKHNISPTEIVELNNLETIKDFIKSGMGSGILPKWCIPVDVQNHKLVIKSVTPKFPSRKWTITYRNGKKMNIAENTLIQLLKDRTSHL